MSKMKNNLRLLIVTFIVLLAETLLHFLIALNFRLYNYSWSQVMLKSELTGINFIQNLMLFVLSIFLFRIVFEFFLKFIIEKEIKKNTTLKMFFSFSLTFILITIFASIYMPSSSWFSDFFQPIRGVKFILLLSVFIISLTRLIIQKTKNGIL